MTPKDLGNKLINDQSVRLQNEVDKRSQQDKLIQPAFYGENDPATGTNQATFLGGGTSNQFNVISNSAIAQGDRLAARPSQGLTRLDDLKQRKKNEGDVIPAPLKPLVRQGGVTLTVDNDFLLNGSDELGSFTWKRPLRGDFTIAFKFKIFGADGLSISVTQERNLNTNVVSPFRAYATLGVKPFPEVTPVFPSTEVRGQLNLEVGELVCAIDSFGNNPLDPSSGNASFIYGEEARAFIFLRKTVPDSILSPFDDPTYLDSLTVANIINRAANSSENTFRECEVSAIGGTLEFKIKDGTGTGAHFADINLSVSLPAPAMGDTVYYQDNYLRINASNGGERGDIIIKDARLIRLN